MFFLQGCRSFNSTPEISDSIYQDLVLRQGEAKSYVENREQHLELSYEQIELSRNNPKEYKEKRRQLLKAKKSLDLARQAYRYINSRMVSRKIAVRKSYKEAYEKGKEDEWSTSEDYKTYQINTKLREAPRVWIRGTKGFSQASSP